MTETANRWIEWLLAGAAEVGLVVGALLAALEHRALSDPQRMSVDRVEARRGKLQSQSQRAEVPLLSLGYNSLSETRAHQSTAASSQ